MKNNSLFHRRGLAAVCLAAVAVALACSIVNAQEGGNGPNNGVFKTPDPFATPEPDTDDTGNAPKARQKDHMTGATPADSGTTAPPASSPAPAVVVPSPAGTTIVNANQRVQATKRGVCENHMSAEDFVALAKGVSWYYNWAASTSDIPPANARMEFIPMAWGHPGDAGALAGYLGGHKPRIVLAINEPNLKGQAFITPEATAALYKEIKEVADNHHIPVVGPNMALGSAVNDSIKARDPITGQQTTYTWFAPFVQAFQFYAQKSKTQTGSMGVHSYNGMGDLRSAVSKMYELTGKPVWVTEFAYWDAKTADDEMSYLRQAVEFLENSPQVAGYAWFMNRVGKNPKLNLLDKESGKLTPLGQEYVKLPSHSAHVFYRVPGLLEAGKYVAHDNMTLEDTTDREGNFDMASAGPGWVDYNLYVDRPGTYVLKFRVCGAPGKIDVVQNGEALASVDCTETQWHTVETVVPLNAGTQTIRICCNGQRLHSIEFAMK